MNVRDGSLLDSFFLKALRAQLNRTLEATLTAQLQDSASRASELKVREDCPRPNGDLIVHRMSHLEVSTHEE